ncbi:MAG: hypothetical protein ACRCTR_05405 [Actinomycetota bacterium]
MKELLVILGLTGTGFLSAIVPVVNAEAAASTTATMSTSLTIIAVISLAIGQTAGKLVVFEAAAGGRTVFHRAPQSSTRFLQWRRRMDRLFQWYATATARRWQQAALTTSAASLGLPPLLGVAIAAGAAGNSRWVFAGCCLIGRTLRFGALAFALDRMLTWW